MKPPPSPCKHRGCFVIEGACKPVAAPFAVGNLQRSPLLPSPLLPGSHSRASPFFFFLRLQAFCLADPGHSRRPFLSPGPPPLRTPPPPFSSLVTLSPPCCAHAAPAHGRRFFPPFPFLGSPLFPFLLPPFLNIHFFFSFPWASAQQVSFLCFLLTVQTPPSGLPFEFPERVWDIMVPLFFRAAPVSGILVRVRAPFR